MNSGRSVNQLCQPPNEETTSEGGKFVDNSNHPFCKQLEMEKTKGREERRGVLTVSEVQVFLLP